jgi:predicted enzyme related to lactoylglutathione lyase
MSMRIKFTTLFVDDKEKALQFYTGKLGFIKKGDFTKGSYRWLTVASPEDPDGVELILEANANPAAKAFQEATRAQGAPATQFLVANLQEEYDRLKRVGVTFTKEPTQVTGSIIAMLDDTCGNLIQLAQLAW